MRIVQTQILRFSSIIGITCLFFALSGCAGMNSSFSCPMKPGYRCDSLDEVNRRIDQDELARRIDSTGALSASIENSADSSDATAPDPSIIKTVTANETSYGESVLRLWIAPYADAAGSYHPPKVRYALLQ